MQIIRFATAAILYIYIYNMARFQGEKKKTPYKSRKSECRRLSSEDLL